MSILVAIAVDNEGFREIIGAAEGGREDKESAREKAAAVSEKLCSMKLSEAAKKVETGIEETLTYMHFPSDHWTRIRTNNGIERIIFLLKI